MTSLMRKIRQQHQSINEQVAKLSQETQGFLSTTAAQRQESSKQQASKLQQFRQDLFNSVWGNKGRKTAKISQNNEHNQVAQQNMAVPEMPIVSVTNTSFVEATLPTPTLAQEAIDVLAAGLDDLQEEPTILELPSEDAVPYEDEVYNYLQQGKSPGLTSIQKALGITHAQAANALRSLVQKGLLNKS